MSPWLLRPEPWWLRWFRWWTRPRAFRPPRWLCVLQLRVRYGRPVRFLPGPSCDLRQLKSDELVVANVRAGGWDVYRERGNARG